MTDYLTEAEQDLATEIYQRICDIDAAAWTQGCYHGADRLAPQPTKSDRASKLADEVVAMAEALNAARAEVARLRRDRDNE